MKKLFQELVISYFPKCDIILPSIWSKTTQITLKTSSIGPAIEFPVCHLGIEMFIHSTFLQTIVTPLPASYTADSFPSDNNFAFQYNLVKNGRNIFNSGILPHR